MGFNWAREAEKEWNGKAGFWNKRSAEMWDSGSRKDIVPFTKKIFPAGAKVCDLGCGDGYGSVKLSEAGYDVTGLDVSEEMLEKARSMSEGKAIQFLKRDISETGLPSSSFDALIAINSLEWTEKPLEVLTEMQRIVKPGGMACVGILGPTAAPRINSFRRLYGEKVICNTMMPWELEQLAAENGWKKADEYGVYKRGATELPLGSLANELRQSLSFMWVFMLENKR
ncbi:class I SAM-dependent methyltransferase [Bacillus sp. T33-2]|uniref:class I SAM-dependent methyltransferase n=1 Tax=Bacillus sp. T33-2 TaxID=2054168 RepID=UPI000C78EE41|nr:class I SAM-dependent methyltransferase [Bacillus sp. T33-2]PLR99666.1 SAM-dependent methyltransferase [Bacillus sp. T33-2]